MTGASPEADMRVGGADNVFTRLGVKNGHGARFNGSFKGGPYRIIIDEAELGRTDWYAYTGDSFGTTKPSEMLARLSATDFAKSMNKSYQGGNEIMFRQIVSSQSFTGIVCESASDRASLLQAFKAEGITEINGVPIAQFVKVGSTI